MDRVGGVIYVGDSRFNGMEICTGKGKEFVIAKDSMGYYWLKGSTPYLIQKLKEDNTDVEEWTIVSNLGVNDLNNIDLYISYYKSLEESGNRVVVVSVNPTEGKRNNLNKDIDAFNKKISESGLEYFNLCGHLREVGFDTVDGLHYNKATNIEIWNEINTFLSYTEEEEFDDWLCCIE